LKFISGYRQQKDVRILWSVTVLRDMIINQRVLFAIHDFLDKTLEANKYIKVLPEIYLTRAADSHFILAQPMPDFLGERINI